MTEKRVLFDTDPIGIERLSPVAGRYYIVGGRRYTTNSPLTLNLLVAIPFSLSRQASFDRVAAVASAGVSSSVLRYGLYADDNGRPGALILDTGTGDAAAAGQVSIVINKTLLPADYHLGVVTQGVAAQVRTTDSFPHGVGYTVPDQWGVPSLSGVSGALPDPFGTPNGFSSVIPLVWLRAA